MKKLISVLLLAALLASSCMLTSCFHEHVFGEWKTVTNATCTKEGLKERVCECGEKETASIPVIDHDYSERTCTQPKTCKMCGKTSGASLGHNYSKATCDFPQTCSRCGQTSGSELGHDYKDHVCTRCGENNITASNINDIIEIKSFECQRNFLGGYEPHITIVNKSSTKTIKYATFVINFINTVGDPVTSQIGGLNYGTVEMVGPVAPGKKKREEFDACFYTSSLAFGYFSIIMLTYTDGTKLLLTRDSIQGLRDAGIATTVSTG